MRTPLTCVSISSSTYDQADQVTDLHTTVGLTTTSRFQYTLDRMGQRTAVTETLTTQTRTIAYTYDGLQRLTGATETPGTTYEYTYDLAGNRTDVRENGAPVANLSYNDANQVIGWSYDAAGNLLSDGTTTRSYDALNRMVAHDSTSYTDNGDGVLVSAGTITYAQDLAAPLSQVLSDGTANYLYGHDRLRALGGPWYVGDALGSVRQTLDDAGAVLATTSYDPWGTPQGNLSAPFGFTGELHSAGQVYLRARWYAPGQGTFTSRDPFAGFPEMPYSLHAYQYAYSNPVRWTDPSGRCVLPDGTPCLQPGDTAIPCGQAGQPPCVEPTPTAVPTPNGNPLLAGGGFFATKPHPALIAIGACLLAVGIGSVTVQTRPQTEYVVVPELLRPAPEPDPTVTVEMPPIWSPVPTPMPTPTPTPQPAFVNLDTGTAIAFIAEGSPLLPQLEAYVQDKQMVMTRTAFLEFVRIVTTIGGVSERTRAGTFLQRVNEVDDDPSDRALNLRVTGGLGPNDIVIFGTADRLGIITMSADERAVRASSNQGVDFVVYLHPPVPLTGR